MAVATRDCATDTSISNDYLIALRKTASRVMHEAMLSCAGLADVYHLITASAARALNVQRVGVWLFDESGQHLHCVDLYRLDDDCHSIPAPLVTANAPHYVSAISSDELVAVDDTYDSSTTAELVDGYLRPQGITSMLDAPIVREGRTIGVLCHEHIGPARHWLAGELAFAETLADFVTLSMESVERKALEQETLRLASIIAAMPDLVATVTPEGTPTYLNPAGHRLLGGGANDRVETFNVRAIYSDEHWQHRQQVIMPHVLQYGSWSGETELTTLQGEQIPVWQSVVIHRDLKGDVQYLSSIIHDLREQKHVEWELRQREQLLAQLNSQLEQRVAERTTQLHELNQNLETFAFSVSHDLKAPLRGIDGYSRLLLEEYRSSLPVEAQTFIDNVREATTQMNQLIDDLLAYSRVGRRELSNVRFSSRQVINRILAERDHDVRESGLQIDDRIEDVTLEADLDCVIQILRNLIDNAVKFSKNVMAPKIELSTRIDGGKIVFSVKDNGCGFDMKYYGRIFTIFQRLHRSEEYPGTGVGLAIVTKAAERIAGRVWATSSPGEGATFYLELPYVH